MIDLIKRLEAATEGSLDLDCDIHRALNPLYVQNSQWPALFLHAGHSRRMSRGESRSHQVPHYTRSLDAALTLAPKGCHGEIDWWGDHSDAVSWPSRGRASRAAAYVGPTPDRRFRGIAETMPLALCISALKARLGLK